LKYFLYTILNPTSSGITKDPLAGGRPNALSVIREGGTKSFRWFHRRDYENARRKNPKVDKERYFSSHTLTISRLPGLKSRPERSYLQTVEALIEQQRQAIIAQRRAKGVGFLGMAKLSAQTAGAKPHYTKNSTKDSYNPLVLSDCPRTKRKRITEYMNIWELYHKASEAFRQGDLSVSFPVNCYRPTCFVSS
jgi:hypothetical protein